MNIRFLPALAATLAAMLSLTLASCGNDGDITTAVNSDNVLLAYIPEDTPYLAGNLEPIPAEVIEAMFMRLQPALDAVQAELAESRADLARSADSDDTSRDIALAVLDELDGKLNPEGLTSLGFSMEPRQAIYGMGMFPVVRISLGNAQALRDTLARIESSSGVEFPEKEHQGQSYWKLADDHPDSHGDFGGGIYLAIIEQGGDAHLAFSIFPTEAEGELLPAFLGQVMPENETASKRLAKINQQYGYTPYGTGLIEFQRAFDQFVDPDSLLRRSINQDGSHDFPNLDEVCQAEISALIARAPRMVAGATEMTPSAMGGQYRLELADDLASDLAALVSSVPSAPMGSERLLEFAMGIRIGAARDFLITKTTELSQKPFECEALQNINVKASEALTKLNTYPLPPLVNNLLGIRASLSQMPENQHDIATARGTIALHVDKPEMVVGMATMLLPQMEEITIEKGGPPVELPQSMIPVPGVVAYAAMSDSALGIALGQDESTRLSDYLDARPGNTGSFFSVNYDMATYMDQMDALTDDLIQAGAMNSDEQGDMEYRHDDEVGKAFRDAFKNMAGRNQMELRFDKHGFAIDNRVQFRD